MGPLIDGIFEVRCACKIANLTTKGNGHKKKKSDWRKVADFLKKIIYNLGLEE